MSQTNEIRELVLGQLEEIENIKAKYEEKLKVIREENEKLKDYIFDLELALARKS